MIKPVITGTGSHIPEIAINNDSFLHAQFFDKEGGKLYKSNKAIIEKFSTITGIEERRYTTSDRNTSDLAYLAAIEAIASAGIDKEMLDYIIVAHNFGDVAFETNRTSQVPTIASKVKALLEIHNPDCVAYDLPFGCPGWVEGMIQANYFIKSGDAKKCMVIGAETLSRVIDPHDRDSMIFSDGAGATILEAANSTSKGILAHKTQTHALGYISALNMDRSCSPFANSKQDLYLKMEGRKVYEFALTHVPGVIKSALDKAGVSIDEVSKVLIHQANEKMDMAILTRLFQLYERTKIPEGIMPMTIDRLGNSSVATVPTLLDLLIKGQLKDHAVSQGEIIVLASVGAGMNINAIVYRM
jgi:3-oxoacyl-[acyl-carrier-protein] synthase III